MAFDVFTDSCSNLPGKLLKSLNIRVLPCTYTVNGELVNYDGDVESFDAKKYYDLLRSGAEVKTSLLNTQTFLDHFLPVLEAGRDIVYTGLSAGISGTIQAATIARAELLEKFPERKIFIVDSMGAGLGTGLLACLGADLRNAGKTIEETVETMVERCKGLCEFFIVDDLNFLHRTGRVSAATAAIGKVLNIKPILRGDETGHITSVAKARGRKKAVETILQLYKDKALTPGSFRVAISHGDVPEEAESLAQKVREIAEPAELIVCPHEPFTGAHVGPGMLALFFFGTER